MEEFRVRALELAYWLNKQDVNRIFHKIHRLYGKPKN